MKFNLKRVSERERGAIVKLSSKFCSINFYCRVHPPHFCTNNEKFNFKALRACILLKIKFNENSLSVNISVS